MADLEFVDPTTGAALGAHAFGTVAAGTLSASWAARLRYKWGQSGSGLNQNALVLEVSTDGGATWRTDLNEFTIAVTAVQNVPLDPLFLGTTAAARRTTRLELPALRAGCAYDLAIVFSPTLHTGAATTAYSWRLGVAYNESFREIALIPGAPSGILTGLGDITISEWIIAPTLVNATDKVTVGLSQHIFLGIYHRQDNGDVALSQDDYNSAALIAGEEYVAVISANGSGTLTATKGVKATAGAAVTPAYPTGELPCAVVRVPFGGVIVTSTLLAVSRRCLVTDAGGLVVTVQPGRAVSPGYLATPSTVQTLTLADASTVYVYLSPQGVAASAAVPTGIPLATVTTAGGDITALSDTRRILYPEPIRLACPGVETAAANVDRHYIPYSWTAEQVGFYALTPSAGASGDTRFDIKIGGNTVILDSLYANEALVVYKVSSASSGAAGWLTAEITVITTGGTQAEDIEVLVWLAQVA